MVWFDLSVGKHKVKYTPLNPEVPEYPDCDEQGNILKRVSGKFEKGHFINEKTGETHEKAFKLIKGKASSGWTGKIKEVGNPTYVEKVESEDLLSEKEFLVESDSLYKELLERNQAVTFKGWFGNGYRIYRVYVTPSELYKGFCVMSCGRGLKSQIIKEIIGTRAEYRALRDKLKQIEVNIQKVNQAQLDDIDI